MLSVTTNFTMAAIALLVMTIIIQFFVKEDEEKSEFTSVMRVFIQANKRILAFLTKIFWKVDEGILHQ